MAKRIKIDITTETMEDFLELFGEHIYRYLKRGNTSGKFGHRERNGIGGEFTVEDVEPFPPTIIKHQEEG